MTPGLPARLPVQRIAAGTVIYRAHTPPRSALFFGPAPGSPPTQRFHAPDGSFLACFAGLSEEAAFAEGVLHGPVPTALVSAATLSARSIAELHVIETIRAVPLYGRYLMRLGATSTVTHGDDYSVSQSWAKAIHDHTQAADGILYTSRHDETTFSLALFGRAAHKLVEGGSHALSPVDLRTLTLLDHYGLGLTPLHRRVRTPHRELTRTGEPAGSPVVVRRFAGSTYLLRPFNPPPHPPPAPAPRRTRSSPSAR